MFWVAIYTIITIYGIVSLLCFSCACSRKGVYATLFESEKLTASQKQRRNEIRGKLDY